MAVNHHGAGINKITVSTSFFEKNKDGQCHNCSSSYQILINICDWVRVTVQLLKDFLRLPGFQRQSFALMLFLLTPSVSLVQCFLITFVFIGLFQPNLATLDERRSRSCEVPMAFIKIAGLACALICLLLKVQTLLILPGSGLLAPEYPRDSGLATARVILQVMDQIKVHRGSWGHCGDPGRNKRKVDICQRRLFKQDYVSQ